MEDYKLTCEFCGAAVKVESYTIDHVNRSGQLEKITMILCFICASTPAGVMHEYPQNYEDDTRDLAKLIAFIGNQIIEVIKEQKIV